MCYGGKGNDFIGTLSAFYQEFDVKCNGEGRPNFFNSLLLSSGNGKGTPSFHSIHYCFDSENGCNRIWRRRPTCHSIHGFLSAIACKVI
jgi:hypothetical protein